MLKILDWIKTHGKPTVYIKPQKFVEIKRSASAMEFIEAGHPLYDNIVSAEENKVRLLAPNETAYDETSLLHNFVCIVTYNNAKYLVINSFKHFKEQSIGGLLQFDENIYHVIPFFENEDEYQTKAEFTFKETYEYDHPVENYALICNYNQKNTRITLDRGKKPLTIRMIDEQRPLFTEKLPHNQIEMIDYVVIPAINYYVAHQEKNNHIAS